MSVALCSDIRQTSGEMRGWCTELNIRDGLLAGVLLVSLFLGIDPVRAQEHTPAAGTGASPTQVAAPVDRSRPMDAGLAEPAVAPTPSPSLTQAPTPEPSPTSEPAPASEPVPTPARTRAPTQATPPAKATPAKATPPPRTPPVYHRYRHTVVPGETLGGIAQHYQVTVAALQRWNDMEGTLIRPGEVLDIYTRTPVRTRRTLIHVVQRGETLGGIAKKHSMEAGSLARLNRLTLKSPLKIGARLKVVTEGPEVPSVSVGTPQEGRLVNGEQLPAGPAYHIRSPARTWGTNATISYLLKAFRQLDQKFPGSVAAIGDISTRHGGHLEPHASHQNGRDVDISFYVKGRPKLTGFVAVTPKTLDARRTLALLEALLATDGVQYIFISYPLQAPLYELARQQGWSKNRLTEVFQHPRGPGASAIITHEPGHHDHLHIRFRH